MDDGTQVGLQWSGCCDSSLVMPMLLLEGIAFVVLVVLLVRNLKVFRKGDLDAEVREGLRLRLLVCKRIALAILPIILIQGYEIVVLVLFLLSTGAPKDVLVSELGQPLSPIFIGILVMLFGAFQYLIMDTIRQYRERKYTNPSH